MAWKHGYYSPRLFPWDIEYIEETKARLARGEVRLDLEMALCRLAMGRLLEATNEFREMPAERLAEAAGALFRGAKVVSKILEAREAVEEMERERQALDGWAEGLVWILEEE